jgi:hypothetical protein
MQDGDGKILRTFDLWSEPPDLQPNEDLYCLFFYTLFHIDYARVGSCRPSKIRTIRHGKT